MNSRRPLPGRCHRQAVPFVLAAVIAIAVSFSPTGLAFTGKELLPIRQIATFGGKEGKSRLRQPSAVAVGRDGKVFILDGTVNRVAVFSPDGRFLYDFGTEYLNMPLGMSLDSKDHVYVTDTRNGRIQVFSSKGEHLRQISLPKGKEGEATRPVDIAIDNKRRLAYVVDNRNHRVLILDLRKNRIVKTVGKMGMDEGEFRWPFSVAVGKQGVVYVVDVINTTVRTIHPDENWAFGFNIGKWGIQKGELFRPKGIAIDAKGNIFVSDSFLGVVQIFDPKGHFLSVLSDKEGKIHRFTTPARLYIDGKGRLYVVEMFANRINLFEISR